MTSPDKKELAAAMLLALLNDTFKEGVEVGRRLTRIRNSVGDPTYDQTDLSPMTIAQMAKTLPFFRMAVQDSPKREELLRVVDMLASVLGETDGNNLGATP